MLPGELITFAERLERDLVVASERYHLKSDLRLILEYESTTVRAYVTLLVSGKAVPADLRKSPLLGEWGQGYDWGEPDLLQRAAQFYRELRAHGVAID